MVSRLSTSTRTSTLEESSQGPLRRLVAQQGLHVGLDPLISRLGRVGSVRAMRAQTGWTRGGDDGWRGRAPLG